MPTTDGEPTSPSSGRIYRSPHPFTNVKATPFMQYRNPVGLGPSSNTCLRCASHCRQDTSVLSTTLSFALGAQKLGHPVPESNFVSERNSAASQQTHRNNPFWCSLRLSAVYGRSVPACRATLYARGESCCFHCASVFTTRGTTAFPRSFPSAPNETIVTVGDSFSPPTEANAGRRPPPSPPDGRSTYRRHRPQKRPPVPS